MITQSYKVTVTGISVQIIIRVNNSKFFIAFLTLFTVINSINIIDEIYPDSIGYKDGMTQTIIELKTQRLFMW